MLESEVDQFIYCISFAGLHDINFIFHLKKIISYPISQNVRKNINFVLL